MSLLIAAIVFLLILWLISIVPVPDTRIKTGLYIIAIIGAIVYLVRFI